MKKLIEWSKECILRWFDIGIIFYEFFFQDGIKRAL